MSSRRVRSSKPRVRPFYVVLILFGIAIGVWMAIDWLNTRRVTITFHRSNGEVPPLELTFYPEQFAFTSPSPPPSLGQLTITGGSVTVGSDFVPERGVVRYRGEGIGAGVAHVQLGVSAPSIELRSPQAIAGRVGQPICHWWMGWRCLAFRPIVDAEIVMMGGGEHGVDLVTTTTDDEGRFNITGFDGDRSALGVRVRAKGFGIEHRHVEELRHEGEDQPIALIASPPRRGRLQLDVDLDPTSLTVLARNLPGVQATPDADGNFVLEHIPLMAESRIVLHGLPDTCSYLPVRTARDKLVEVRVVAASSVRGQVIDVRTNRPLIGALVWIDDLDPVRTDADGYYELPGVIPGDHEITAQWSPRREPVRIGKRTMLFVAGERYDDIEISID